MYIHLGYYLSKLTEIIVQPPQTPGRLFLCDQTAFFFLHLSGKNGLLCCNSNSHLVLATIQILELVNMANVTGFEKSQLPHTHQDTLFTIKR